MNFTALPNGRIGMDGVSIRFKDFIGENGSPSFMVPITTMDKNGTKTEHTIDGKPATDKDIADILMNMGANVKYSDQYGYSINIKANFKQFEPGRMKPLVAINTCGKYTAYDDAIRAQKALQNIRIEDADITIVLVPWKKGNKEGICACLEEIEARAAVGRIESRLATAASPLPEFADFEPEELGFYDINDNRFGNRYCGSFLGNVAVNIISRMLGR